MSIAFGDARVSKETFTLNHRQYCCYIGHPAGTPKATVVLLHGWPDLAFGWRRQIPALIDAGFRTAALDMLGYGDSDAPVVPPEPLSAYSYRSAAQDIRQLATHLGCSEVVLGGHDWGAQVAYRTAQWYPDLVSHLFIIAAPYRPPAAQFTPLDDLVKAYPQFGYQKQIASGAIEQEFRDAEGLKAFLNILDFSGDPQKQDAFEPTSGFNFELLRNFGKGSLLSNEELEFYVSKYSRNGLHGPCNWYRTRQVNFEDDQLLPATTIEIPVLYIGAERDIVFSPVYTKDMEQYIPHLTRNSVDANHYAHMEKWAEVNSIVLDWLGVHWH